MDNEKKKIIQTYRNYIQAFQSLNPRPFFPFTIPLYFHIFPEGAGFGLIGRDRGKL